MSTIDETSAKPMGWRAWTACALMLLATALNYMDRQALSQQAADVQAELHLSDEQYGRLEYGFGIAFAAGGIVIGWLVDRVSLRWMYPAILLAWSVVGFLTGSATSFRELLIYRVLLGFFETGQWPCALAASQRLLSRGNRALGNSILQSGASIGAIATPFVVLALNSGDVGGWRPPFRVIGGLGVVWVAAWLLLIRPGDLDGPREQSADRDVVPATDRATTIRRIIALIVVVIMINICWQYFRAWMPKMLDRQYGYDRKTVQLFSSAYYVAAGVGCLVVGYASRWLVVRGWSVHHARLATFAACVALTATSLAAVYLPASPLLLGLLLAIGFGSLGQFPPYYAFTQEISARRMGLVTGLFSLAAWGATAPIHPAIGRWIDQTGSYTVPNALAGLAPAVGLVALLALWNSPRPSDQSSRSS